MTMTKTAERVVALGRLVQAGSAEVTVRYCRRAGTDDCWTAAIGNFSATATSEHEAVSRLEAAMKAKILDNVRYHEGEANKYRTGLQQE